MRRTLSGLISVVCLVAVFFISTANAAVTTIKLQSIYPKVSGAGQCYVFFAKKVDEYTNSEVMVKLFWPGQLVKTKEVFSALQRGMIEAAGCSLLYYAGVVPESLGQWLPYSWKDPRDVIEVYLNHGYLDLMREATAKHGVHYIAPIGCGTMGLMTKFPIHKLEDLKGKKIRAAGVAGKTAEALGAVPVALVSSEQYVALQRGTIDGAIYPWYTIEDYNFFEVIDYISSPALNTPGIVDLLISGKVWNKLSPAHKEAIDRAGIEAMWRSFLYGELKDKRAYSFCKEKGIENITLTPKELKRFKEATSVVYGAHAKKSDLCARQVEILKKYWKKKGR